MGILSRLFGRPKNSGDSALVDDSRLGLEREVQQLRLELAETQRALSRLQGEQVTLKAGESKLVTAVVAAEREALFVDLAGPLAHLLTQAALTENGKELNPHDVLAVALRLARTLGDHGVIPCGEIGASELFDPDRHLPLTTGGAPKRGQAVKVRVVGLTYQGKMLRKIGVEAE